MFYLNQSISCSLFPWTKPLHEQQLVAAPLYKARHNGWHHLLNCPMLYWYVISLTTGVCVSHNIKVDTMDDTISSCASSSIDMWSRRFAGIIIVVMDNIVWRYDICGSYMNCIYLYQVEGSYTYEYAHITSYNLIYTFLSTI